MTGANEARADNRVTVAYERGGLIGAKHTARSFDLSHLARIFQCSSGDAPSSLFMPSFLDSAAGKR